MAVVDRKPLPALDGPAEFFILQKLRPVVGGQAAEVKPEVRQFCFQPIKDRPHCGGLFVLQQEDTLPQGLALGEGQERPLAPGLAHHQVHLLVAVFLPLPDAFRPVRDRGQLRMRHPADRPVPSLSLFPLLPEVLVAQAEEHPLVYVAVQGGDADAGGESFPPGCRQRRPGGVPLPPVRLSVPLDAQHLPLQKLRKGPVFSYFEGASLGGLVVVMDRLALVRRVPLHIPVVHRVQIPPPGHLVVDGLPAKPQLPGYLRHRQLCPQQRLQLVPFRLPHVVLFFRHRPASPLCALKLLT